MKYFKNQIFSFKGRKIKEHLPFRVYRNLNCKTEEERYSILQGGLVVAHASQLTVFDSKFIVSKKGQERAQRLKHKTVHAFIQGRLKKEKNIGRCVLEKLQYNYFGQPSFFTVDMEGNFSKYVETADAALLCAGGVVGFNCS